MNFGEMLKRVDWQKTGLKMASIGLTVATSLVQAKMNCNHIDKLFEAKWQKEMVEKEVEHVVGEVVANQ